MHWAERTAVPVCTLRRERFLAPFLIFDCNSSLIWPCKECSKQNMLEKWPTGCVTLTCGHFVGHLPPQPVFSTCYHPARGARLFFEPFHPLNFSTLCTDLPMKMKQTDCSKMAFKPQMPDNNTKGNIQHSKHNESLKSISHFVYLSNVTTCPSWPLWSPSWLCGQSVTDFWGWDAHEARLRCPDEVDGDIWIWSTRRGLIPKFY
jgi:hypothetical protein